MKTIKHPKSKILLITFLFAATFLASNLAIRVNRNWDSETYALTAQLDDTSLRYVGRIGGLSHAVTTAGNYAYLGEGHGLTILDISDPENINMVSRTPPLPDSVQDVAVDGNYAYVVIEQGLRIINIADPESANEVGYIDLPGEGTSVVVAEGYAYYISDRALHIIDVSVLTEPEERGTYDFPGTAKQIDVAGNYVYLAASSAGLRIVDVSDPTTPKEASILDTPGQSEGVTVKDTLAYISDLYGGLRIIDVADPSKPFERGFYTTGGFYALKSAVQGNYAYIADGNGLSVIDISNPEAPTLTASLDPAGDSYDVAVSGNHALLVAPGATNRLSVINVTVPAHPTESANYYSFGSPGADVVAVNGDYAYLTTRYPVDTGLTIIDISDPEIPRWVSYIQPESDPEGIVIGGNHAYVSGGGLGVIDVSDPAAPSEIGYHKIQLYFPGLAVDGDYAYIAGDGMFVIDTSNPASPTEKSFYLLKGFATDVAVSNGHAYLSLDNLGLQIIDVSDKSAPVEVGYLDTGRAYGVAQSGNYVYVAGSDGLKIVDVKIPSTPIQIGGFFPFEGTAHDVAIQGKHAFLSEYGSVPGSVSRNYNGLRILDVSEPSDPIDAGFFETTGDAEGVAVAGGFIYVADSEGGLVILHHDEIPQGCQIYLPLTLR